MKNNSILFALLIASVIIFSSCTGTLATASDSSTSGSSRTKYSSGTGSSSGTSTGSSTELSKASAESEAAWDYSADSPVYEISSDTNSITVSGLTEGQKIYLAKINPTSSTMSSSYTQYVSASTNLTLSSSAGSSTSSSTSSSSSGSTPGMSSGGPNRNHFLPAQNFSRSESLVQGTNVCRAVGSITSGVKVTQLDLTESDVGSATKQIYVDCDTDISEYALATATLRALGENCYVWVVNGYFEEDSSTQSYTTNSYSTSSATSYTTTSDEKISSDLAQNFADKFDAMYEMIRNVFGNESDEIFYTYSGGNFYTKSMDYLSDTGTKVNIVVYDIGADHTNSSDSDSTGVVGYFYAKDYYPSGEHIGTLSNGLSYGSNSALNNSNEGKYFYIDAYYSNENTSMVCSTLAHEFQHMINWGVKTMDQGLSSGTAYNEMLSMLCEDMMYSYLHSLDEENFTEDDAPYARLPLFEKGYKNVGLEYRSTSTEYIMESYSNNYAFGAWLVRSFGGVKLIQQMSQNDCVDTDSIVNAVNAVNGTDYTIKDLLSLYAQACIIGSGTENYTVPSFENSYESGASLTYTDGDVTYGYPICALDLWNLESLLPETYEEVSGSDYYKFDGPELYGYNAKYDLRPYGMLLVEVGEVDSSDTDVVITFGNSSVYEDEGLYLIVE